MCGSSLLETGRADSAIIMADVMGSMKHEADVMVENDGHLDLAWTYGVDPLPQQPVAA